MYQYVKAFLVGLSFSLSIITQAQNDEADYNVNSPYSRIGIGDILPPGTVRNIGMGNTGVSHSHPEFFNPINPALLINNRAFSYDSLLNILDGAVYGQARRVSDQFNSQTSGGINFFYFNYSLPINRRWTAAVGLRPLSDVSFYTQTTAPVNGSPSDTAVISFSGFGGVNQAFLANAFRITRSLNFGVHAAYIFGNVNHEYFSYLRTYADSVKTGYNNKTFYSGFLLRPGLSFRKALENKHKDSAIFFNAGFTYEFSAGLKGTESLIIDRRSPINQIISREEVESVTNNVTLPPTMRLGFSFDKHGLWNYALDFSFTNWKGAKGFSSQEIIENSFTVSAGAEWGLIRKRDRGGREDEMALNRRYFRTGISFSQTPYVVSGNRVNDLSLTVGYSLPVGKTTLYRYPRPKLNLAMVMGQRGSVSNGGIKDLYLMGYVGITINDKWFRKRRIE